MQRLLMKDSAYVYCLIYDLQSFHGIVKKIVKCYSLANGGFHCHLWTSPIFVGYPVSLFSVDVPLVLQVLLKFFSRERHILQFGANSSPSSSLLYMPMENVISLKLWSVLWMGGYQISPAVCARSYAKPLEEHHLCALSLDSVFPSLFHLRMLCNGMAAIEDHHSLCY
jgi:hypothetical protein